jgi:hypothetical protein
MAISARYWRIRATAQNFAGSDILRVYTFRGYTSVDNSGPEVFASGTAFASSYWYLDLPSNAIDAAASSYWMSYSLSTFPEWLAVDCGAAVELNCIHVCYIGDNFPTEFAIDYSADGTTWTELGVFSAGLQTNTCKTFEAIQSPPDSGIARPLIDGMGHNPLIDSRVLIR